MDKSPVIGITLGDANGIGPEIALKAAHARWPAGTRIVLVGSPSAVRREASRSKRPSPPSWEPGGAPPARKVTCWDPSPHLTPRHHPGRITTTASRAAYAWITAAVDACLEGHLDAVVTAPITKEGFAKAGIDFPGHTELLAERTRTKRFAMMLFGGPLRVVLATRHVPLRDVADELTPAGVREAVTLTHEALPWLGLRRRRIAVCGLNPHAGDGGRLGREEKAWITRVLRGLGRKGIDLAGPLPADTVFHQAVRGEFDAVVAMYHDQGLAPLKMIAFEDGVNLTLGLPIVRTSPDHGTAFGIAGTGRANPSSMVAAIRAAIDLAGRPNPWVRQRKRGR